MEFIFLLPIVIVLILSTAFFLKSKKFFSSLIVSGSFALFPAIFWGIRLLGPFFGGADIGAGLVLIGSSLLLSFVVIFIFILTNTWALKKAIRFALGVFIFNLGISTINHAVLIKQHKDYQQKSILNCHKLPFHCAIRDGHFDQLQQFKEMGHSLEEKDGWGRTPLYYAYYSSGKEEFIKKLISMGANINVLDSSGYPLIHHILFNSPKNFQMADYFLQHQINLNILYGSHKKMNLLNESIIRNDIEVIDYLMSRGADPYLKDEFGYNACDRLSLHKVKAPPSLEQKCRN